MTYPSQPVMIRSFDGIDDLVPISGHESLQRVPADDERHRLVHGGLQLLDRRPDVVFAGLGHRGQLPVSVPRRPQSVEDVQPAESE